MRLLDGSRIAADLDKVRECFRAVDPVECVHEKRVQGEFGSGLLTYHLCAALGRDEWFNPLVPQIEADLAKLAAKARRFDELISAFRRKLLNDEEFDDVVYEIAAAAVFTDILDGGSISLEEPLDQSTKKNPDVTGTWGGRRTRAEVTVIHDDWPPRYSHEAQRVVESADVPGGYMATLNVPLTEKTDAGADQGHDRETVCSPAHDREKSHRGRVRFLLPEQRVPMRFSEMPDQLRRIPRTRIPQRPR